MKERHKVHKCTGTEGVSFGLRSPCIGVEITQRERERVSEPSPLGRVAELVFSLGTTLSLVNGLVKAL